ncbi:MAG: hypothetical protein ACI9VS_000744 [Candidatus Binatia bacterium]
MNENPWLAFFVRSAIALSQPVVAVFQWQSSPSLSWGFFVPKWLRLVGTTQSRSFSPLSVPSVISVVVKSESAASVLQIPVFIRGIRGKKEAAVLPLNAPAPASSKST